MKVYLVGGAVRDKLLKHTTQDKDWVVVGSSIEEMLSLGFHQVGKDFPVFLHPDTREEYALARTEKKSGTGYTGFICDSSASVTLHDDLHRRDLTINAIAEDTDGNIIDPFDGQGDIKQKVLRHVSTSFVEDPLRVLRVARFAARYHHLGFTIANETTALMSQMVNQGELSHLVEERVWKELSRALTEPNPDIFIRVLRECNALNVILPEIDALFGIPQPAQHHPEIDTGEHALLCLNYASQAGFNTRVRFSALVHDLGKALTPPDQLPQHIDHERRGIDPIKKLCQRIKAPNEFRELALLTCKYHLHCHRAKELKPSTLLNTLESLDAFRRSERFEEFLQACEADARGRHNLTDRPYPQADVFRQAFTTCSSVDIKPLIEKGFSGKALGNEIRRLRIAAIQSINRN